jgi:chemotaxis signal transduction protein
MSTPAPALNKAAHLREVFDRAFTVPAASQRTEQTESLLSIRVGEHPYALIVKELSAVTSDRKIVAIPSPLSELIGIAGVRGGIVPVYSLAMLLGHERQDQERWLVLCQSENPVVFAFTELEGYIQVPMGQLQTVKQQDTKHEYLKHVIRTGEKLRPVISISSLVELISTRCKEKRHL